MPEQTETTFEDLKHNIEQLRINSDQQFAIWKQLEVDLIVFAESIKEYPYTQNGNLVIPKNTKYIQLMQIITEYFGSK